MNILLIFPPTTIYGNDPTLPSTTPPLGLAYIAGYLKKHGYKNVDILDARSLSKNRVLVSSNKALYGLTEDEIYNHIHKTSPDVVGISCMFTAYSSDAHRVAGIVKKVNREIPVIFGGAHASTFPDLVLKDTNIDIVAHYEGEETFLNLVMAIENKKEYTDVKGISFRDRLGTTVTNPPRDFIGDLDTIPFPARHLLDMGLYLENKPSFYAMRAPSTTMITSRGCPNECVYCTIQSVWGKRRWRARSAQNVVDEMELLNKEYGIREIYLMDDSVGTSKKRLQEICSEMIKRGLDIKWTTPNGIAHWYLDEETLRLMKKAGCYRITFGIESGNKEIRKFLGKPFPLEQAERIIHTANNLGMWTSATFILGFPFETQKEIMDTINFACKCGVDMAVFFLLCPHPGTRVYEIFKKEGLLNLDHFLDPAIFSDSLNFEEIGIKLAGRGARTKYFTPEELQRYLALAYRSFFKAGLKHSLSALRIIRKIKNKDDFIYACKIARIGIKMALESIFGKIFVSQNMHKYRKNNLKLEEALS